MIKQPIDLIRIQQKLRTDEYQTLEQFSDDIQLLLTNAKTFYRVKKNKIFYFSLNRNIYFRKIPMNGVMPMIYRNIFFPK
jgi:hypothetical protein